MTDTTQSLTPWEGFQVDGQVFDVQVYDEQGEPVENPNFYCLVDSDTNTMVDCRFEASAATSSLERPSDRKVDEV